MNKNQKFLYCEQCGNLVGQLQDSGKEIYCCKAPMKRLQAQQDEAAYRPRVRMENEKIIVESQPNAELEWVYVESEAGGARHQMRERTRTVFDMANDHAKAVYAFDTKHGLWQKELV